MWERAIQEWQKEVAVHEASLLQEVRSLTEELPVAKLHPENAKLPDHNITMTDRMTRSPVPALPQLSTTLTLPQRKRTPSEDFTRKKQTKNVNQVNKRPSQQYHLLGSEVPDNVGGLQKSLVLHICVLWNLADTKEVPGTSSATILWLFSAHFLTEESLYDTQTGPELIPLSLIKIWSGIPFNTTGWSATQIQQIKEHILTYMQSRLATFGLTSWCPDLRQTPYSLYNSACHIIALDTFKQALVSHTYATLQPNLIYATNMNLLIKLYDHFVHYYMFTRFKCEEKTARSVRAADEATPLYRNHAQLAKSRLTFLQENGYLPRYQSFVNAKATSDDKLNLNDLTIQCHKVYWIKRRPERSVEAEKFIHILDQKREADARRDPSKCWSERLCMIPNEHQQDSEFHALPEKMPIDYFSPTFFNKLQPRLCNRVAIHQIAFLPDVTKSLTGIADERLDDKSFLNKYGANVLCKYNLVDSSDLADEEDWIVDEEDEKDGVDIQEDEMELVMSKCGLLATHLSMDEDI